LSPTARSSSATAATRAAAAVASLRRLGTKAGRDGMARYAIPSERAFGVSMANVQKLA